MSSEPTVMYVPVLPTKQGEVTALRDSTPAVLRAMRPLMEVPPLKWDWDDDCEAETVDQQVAAHGTALPKNLSGLPGFFLDMPHVADGALMQSGAHPVADLLTRCRAAGLPVTPVTGPERHASYRAAVTAALDHRGVMLRLRGAQVSATMTTTLLADELHALGIAANQVDLMIDIGRIEAEPSVLAVGVGALLRHPTVTQHAWRSITVASGGFPESMSAFNGVGQWEATRHDRDLWMAVVAQLQATERVPWFGDYAVQVPDPEAINPKVMTMSANIRYTSEQDWFVLKGRTISGKNAKATFEEFRVLCGHLVNMPQYRGEHFSEGDRYITGCAAGTESTGNAGTWRKNGTSHHLAHVVDALASTGAP